MPKAQVRNVIQSVLSEPWLIRPEKLQDIVSVVEARANGNALSDEEITKKFGAPAVEADDEPQIIEGVEVINVDGVLAPRMNLMTRMSGGTSTQQLAGQALHRRHLAGPRALQTG